MAMQYVTIKASLAEELSIAIYDLMRPPAERDESYAAHGSARYCDYVVNAYDPQWAVLVVPDETINLHPSADATRLTQVISTLVSEGGMTQEEADGIVAGLSASPTGVRVVDFLPPSWAPYIYDAQLAQENGYHVLGEPQDEEDPGDIP